MEKIATKFKLECRMIKEMNPQYPMRRRFYRGVPLLLPPRAKKFTKGEEKTQIELRDHWMRMQKERENMKSDRKEREKTKRDQKELEMEQGHDDGNLLLLSDVASYSSLLGTGLCRGGSLAGKEDYSEVLAELESKFQTTLLQHGIMTRDMKSGTGLENWSFSKFKNLFNANRAFLQLLSSW